MVQSPESSFLAAPSTQRKRRRDDHFDAPTPSLKPWGYIPEHRPLHLLPTKFTTTTTTTAPTTTSTFTPASTTPLPPKQLKTNRTPPPQRRSSPKLKRIRTTNASQEDYQMLTPSSSFDSTTRQPERCHVCSRVQSLVMPSFGTVIACAVCEELTCYVCTRKCDSCEETVCSRCAMEKEVHSFCRRCMGAWKERSRVGEE